MPRIEIDIERCKGCMLCVSVCPKGLIDKGGVLNKKGVHPAKPKSGDCTGCGFCFLICPDAAIEIYK